MKGSIDSIESLGLVDGPGIRTVVFMNGCKLRCQYCHNPEMWKMREANYTPQELYQKIKRFQPYFGKNGGVTFSGGEPLLQGEFLIEVGKLLKQDHIHIALDTAGVGNGNYEEILKYVDLVIFDIKHLSEDGYLKLTGQKINESLKFLNIVQKMNKPLWIRQVIVPGIHDNLEYIADLKKFIKTLKNVQKVEFLPYHKLGQEKYETLHILYPLSNVPAMDEKKTRELYDYFAQIDK